MSQLALFAPDNAPAPEAQLRVPDDQAARLHAGDGDYRTEFISPQEEQQLLAHVDAAPWLTTLRRRVQHYGYRYDYSQRHISAESRLGDLPDWVEFVTHRLMQQDVFAIPPEQMIVNEYQPGQGIAPHSDSPCFGDTLASLSLGSACMMRVFPHRDSSPFDIVLAPRSLVIYRGTSRYQWRHAILARKSDTQNGQKFLRTRRVSLTFRTIASQ